VPTYRCFMCVNDSGTMGRNFEAVAAPGKPVKCPNCNEPFQGLDFTGIQPGSNAQPRGQGHVVEVAVIHYDRPRSKADPNFVNRRGFVDVRGSGCAACDSTKRTGGGGHFSGVPVAVSCLACRATKAWQDDAAEAGVAVVPDGKDFAITPDPSIQGVKLAGK
jgi:hypothetical protein